MQIALKIIAGMVLILVGIFGIVYWRGDVWTLIKGVLGPTVALIGLLFFGLGLSELKN
ncbi:MAG: hypothetical protein HYS32_00955 [Candidatus Woesearchaeota archaeon]|nr:MAG: hypothetical protein HYS32_00955 [Candidatus Woesearchaeota archaeon]